LAAASAVGGFKGRIPRAGEFTAAWLSRYRLARWQRAAREAGAAYGAYRIPAYYGYDDGGYAGLIRLTGAAATRGYGVRRIPRLRATGGYPATAKRATAMRNLGFGAHLYVRRSKGANLKTDTKSTRRDAEQRSASASRCERP